MKKSIILTLTIVVHTVILGGIFIFSGEGEEKAISKIAQPKLVKVEESRNRKQPTAIVQNGTKTHSRISPTKKEFVNYIVKSGDYLSTIARKYKTSVREITVENNLKNDRIYVGQKLTIPQD